VEVFEFDLDGRDAGYVAPVFEGLFRFMDVLGLESGKRKQTYGRTEHRPTSSFLPSRYIRSGLC